MLHDAAMLMLSDALRLLSDASEIQAVATRLLGEWLGASWITYADIDPQQSTPHKWTADQAALIEAVAARTLAAIERARAELELRHSEAVLQSVVASSNDAFCTVELVYDESGAPHNLRLVELNPRFERFTGLRSGQMIRSPDPRLDAVWFDRVVTVAATGEPFRGGNEWSVAGRYWDVFIGPLEEPGRLVIVFRDATTHRLAERRERFRAVLADALRPLADPIAVQGIAAQLLGKHLGAARVLYAEPTADGSGIAIASDYTDGVRSMVGSYGWEELSTAGLEHVLAGETWVSADAIATLVPEQVPAFTKYEIGAVVTVPLVKETMFEALLIVHDRRRQWTDDEVALIEEVAERTWGAIDRARAEQERRRLQEEEHRVSLGLQRALLPESVLQHPEVAIAARYEARSQVLEVGGDWYDSFTLPSRVDRDRRRRRRRARTQGRGDDGQAPGRDGRTRAPRGRTRSAALTARRLHLGRRRHRVRDRLFRDLRPDLRTVAIRVRRAPADAVVDPAGDRQSATGGRSGPLVRDVDSKRPEAMIKLEPGALLILYSDGLVERRRRADRRRARSSPAGSGRDRRRDRRAGLRSPVRGDGGCRQPRRRCRRRLPAGAGARARTLPSHAPCGRGRAPRAA